MPTDRLSEIRALIDRADHAYYGGGQAIMDDAVYDALEVELRTLCPTDERLTRVGAAVFAASILAKREHIIPMGSQNKATNREEFSAWLKSIGASDGTVLHVNLKADGGSVSLEYVSGHLFRAVTRGDGVIGEDITANVTKFRGLPKRVMLDGVPFTGHVRAEIILTTEAWRKLDPELSTNPRNLGNGMSRRKDGAEVEFLQLVAFRAYNEEGREIGNTEFEMDLAIRGMGFDVSRAAVGGADLVWAFYDEIKTQRNALPFWIDGLVVKLNDISAQRDLGIASNCPRGQVALKFPAEGKETTLRSVELSVGHTGAVIPTAKFDPVIIGGTTVSSALLCNWDEIRALNVAIGDNVLVVKRGDIIPKIEAVVSRPVQRVEIGEPTVCPVCGSKLERKVTLEGEESANLYCVNEDCKAKAIGKVSRWLTSLNILGIGDEVLNALHLQLGVEDAADLYTLKDRAVALADLTVSDVGFGQKRAKKIIEAIEAARSLTIEEFIGSLGIDALGKRRVELIRQAVPGVMDKLSSWMDGSLTSVADKAGVPNVATRIVADLDRKRPLIEKLLKNGVTVKEVEAATVPTSDAPSVCITGSLSQPRSHYEALVKAKGWAWKADVSKGLTYLVIADPDSSSSKAVKARKLGTKCIGEAELLSLLS